MIALLFPHPALGPLAVYYASAALQIRSRAIGLSGRIVKAYMPEISAATAVSSKAASLISFASRMLNARSNAAPLPIQ
jgi:hypothetical protein